MINVLFIGGTGLISTACTQLAAARGMHVAVLNRGKRASSLPSGVEHISADIRQAGDAERALGDRKFDSVVNFIAFTPEQIERDIELFADRTDQYIFISSASVYQKPPTDYLITESTPLVNPYWEYSRQKIASEERLLKALRESNFPAVIARPSLTYGDTMIPLAFGSWSHPFTVPDRMLKGLPVIVPGDGTSLWQTTHNSDFAKGLIGLLGRPTTIGHAFHITTDETLTWNQHYETLALVLGVKPKLAHVASEAICRAAPEHVGGLLGDKAHSVVFDNGKIKRFVPDYVATTPLAQGLKRTMTWFRAEPARQTTDPAFTALTERLLG